jgi:hypothetical protein
MMMLMQALTVSGLALALMTLPALAQNEIVIENALPGNPPSEWDVSGVGDGSIQGFATDMSVDQGGTIDFKIDTPSTDYRIDIYRLGYYGGMGARKVATVQPSATLPQAQPACLTDPATGLYDCGNWAVSASWTVPVNAVSGIYIAKLVREDPDTGSGSHIAFVVRDDDGNSEILMATSDATWQAYNQEGGNSLYVGGPGTSPGRAYKVSYNRPVDTRGHEPWDWVFNAEYPMVRWLERNGYDVSYTSNVDTERFGTELLEHEVFVSIGHDEYWSRGMREAVEAARAAGVHLVFLSGNEVYWKTRYEDSIDGSSTPYRTLVCYKENSGGKLDPLPNVWTGLWRDCSFSPPADGCEPENALTGQISWTNIICSGTACGIDIPDTYKDMRLWRNTDIATLTTGQTYTTPPATLGYEWNYRQLPEYDPEGLVFLSETTVSGLTHKMSIYRHPSGSIVFGAGTVQWAWGLDDNHTNGPFPPAQGGPADVNMQQATLNLLAEMGVQPTTLQIDLVPATATGDLAGPVSTITSPGDGSSVSSGPVAITGTAIDVGGGVVGVVEVSTDGGATWERATGRESWSYNWTAPVGAGQVTLLSRAADDFGNQETPGPGVTVTVDGPVTGGGQPAEINCADQVTLETPAAPILVVTDSGNPTNPFGCYLTEILRGEGLVEFQQAELSVLLADLDPVGYLGNFDLVLLGEAVLSTAEEQHFRDYVTAGGNLIAMRPDLDLADLFGLSPVGLRAEQLLQYFAVDTTVVPGAGIVGTSLQYHGEADDYTLAGGTSIADLYNDATTPSANPAVVLNASGSGQAAAFTFDLARSIVLTRQGNPAWQDTEGDGVGGYRPTDMFRNGGLDYNDPVKLPVPQADEEQRFLANLILHMIGTPIPRMWYLPDQQKRMVINTGDSEGSSGSALEPPQNAVAARGGFFTQFMMEGSITSTTPAMEAGWRAAGHETGVHVYGNGPEDFATLSAAYASIVSTINAQFGHGARSARSHTIDWTGWSEMAEIEAANGTGMDCNYYHIPYYLGDPIGANGYFTGSGLPQRFSDENGLLLGIHQALTQWPDEWFANNGISWQQTFDIVTGMLELAENRGYYSAFVNNIHPVRYNGGDITSDWADALWDYCQANSIPMWTAEMLLDFTEARNNAAFDNITWNGTTLAFDFSTPQSGHALTLMVPAKSGVNVLLSLDVNSSPVAFTTETIKGREYALFNVNTSTAQIAATYGLDTTAPILSNVRVESITDATAIVKWETDEPATSVVNYGTSPGMLTLSETVAGFTTAHSVPLSGLAANMTYYYEVVSEDQALNSSTSAEQNFTTPSPRWTETTSADFSDGIPTNMEVIPIGDGALRLAVATGFLDHFDGTTLNAAEWETFNHIGAVIGPTVANSEVTLTGGDFIRSIQTFDHVTLEGVATLEPGGNAHFGMGTSITTVGPGGVPEPHWIIFSAKPSGIEARTRVNDAQGLEVNTVIPGLTPGTQYLYKIVWYPDNTVEFYVDNVLRATHNRDFGTDVYPIIMSSNAGQDVRCDWVSVSGAFALSGTYESSSFNAGGTTQFEDLAWVGSEPAGTTVGFETRTSLDGVSWTPWAALGVGDLVASPDGQFLQYRASLTTIDDKVSPQIEEVSVGYQAGADVTPPVVASTIPADLAIDVLPGANIEINYNEAINPATFSAVISGGVTHTTTFTNGNATAVLDPDVDLGFLTAYTVTVSAGVEDVAGNPTAAPHAFGFTTAAEPSCWVETTVADFSDGTLTDTEITSVGDGEFQLASASSFTDDFTEPDGPAANWTPFPASGGGPTPVWNVTSNVYVHELNSASGTYHPSMLSPSNSPNGDFVFSSRQRIVQVTGLGVLGIVVGALDTETYYFVQWAKGQNAVKIYRRPGFPLIGQATTADPVDGTWYDMRIEMVGTTFNVYIDDVLILTASDPAYLPGQIGLLGYQGSLNEYDDVAVTGSFLAASGTYESSVFDAGEVRDLTTLTYTGSEPVNTTVGFETRSSLDNIAFSPWEAVGVGDAVASPDGRYVQYRALLATSDGVSNPVVEQVDVCHDPVAADVTPPVITNLQAIPQPDGVTAIITWDTDEPADSRVDYGVDPGPLDQFQSDPAMVTSHSITLIGLTPATTYGYRATSADPSTNSTTEPPTASPAATFTTPTPPLPACFVDDLAADFNAGTPTSTYVTEDDDGEVILAPTEGSEFFGSTLPSGWSSTPWTGGGSATVAGGLLTVEQSNVGPDALYGPDRSLEFVASFQVDANQHVGFGTNFSSTPWAIFSTGSPVINLEARTYNGTTIQDVDLGPGLIGTPHLFRIDWVGTGLTDIDSVYFYVDGALVSSQEVGNTDGTTMASRASDINLGPSLVVDWLRMTPYAAAGSFESRVYDSGAGVTSAWDAVTWTSSEPTGTTLDIFVRTGETPIPDANWTGFAQILSSGDPVGASSRYIQYRADMTTPDTDITPVLEDLTIACGPGVDTSPPIVVNTDPADLAVDVAVGTNITIDYNEAISTGTFSASISGGVTFTTTFANGDATVILDPDVDLSSVTTYTVTLNAGIEDLSGNPTASPVNFSFTTEETVCLTETTLADFSDGTFQDTETTGVGDGAVTLSGGGVNELLNDTFTEPDGPASNWTPLDGTWNIVSGEYDFTIASSYAASIITAHSPTDFIIESRQKIVSFSGVGSGGYLWRIQNPTAGNWKNGSYMLQWDTRSGTATNVRVFRWTSGSLLLLGEADLADVVVDTWYNLRVEVSGSNFEVFVDDVSVVTATDATYATGAIGLVGWNAGDTRYDDVVLTEILSGFSPSGTYTSNPHDAGQSTDWLNLNSLTSEPAQTGVSFETRTGPDGISWSAWDPVAVDGVIASPDDQFVQYRATLTTSDPGAAPIVEEVSITCDICTDVTPPTQIADLGATQVKTGTPPGSTAGTTAITVSWTPAEAGAEVSLYRKGFGNYPEYDDPPGSGATPTAPADPAAAVTEGWVLAGTTTGNTIDDAPSTRDFWHYAAFVTDACGNVSAVSNVSGGALNYHLGDVSDGATPGTGDNQVDGADVSALGAAYGTSDGEVGYEPFLDVGPTTDGSLEARPSTDDALQFEDLILFAINFNSVTKATPLADPEESSGNAIVLRVPTVMPVAGGTFDVEIELVADGRVQGLSVPLVWDDAVVEPIGFGAGELLRAQAGQGVVLSPEAGTVDVAIMGTPIRGEGVLSILKFRVKADGDPAIGLGDVDARDAKNRSVDLKREVAPSQPKVPAVTRLMHNAPNPFYGNTVIAFDLARAGQVKVQLFNVAGRLVRTLADEQKAPGAYRLQWDGRDNAGRQVSSGIYLLRFTAPGYSATRRLVKIR